MARMKRLVLIALAVAAFAPATASASVPCRDRIYNDWYADGKIATTYSPSCYRDAIRHIPADARTYSSLADDIRSAMQGALARRRGGTNVPAQVGKGGKGGVQGASATLTPTKTTVSSGSPKGTREEKSATTNPSETIAASPTSSSDGGGIPMPILVLGALALLLAAVGAVGAGVKHRRR
jgi:hypothetical protein